MKRRTRLKVTAAIPVRRKVEPNSALIDSQNAHADTPSKQNQEIINEPVVNPQKTENSAAVKLATAEQSVGKDIEIDDQTEAQSNPPIQESIPEPEQPTPPAPAPSPTPAPIQPTNSTPLVLSSSDINLELPKPLAPASLEPPTPSAPLILEPPKPPASKPPSSNDTLSASPAKFTTNRSCFIRPVPRLDGHGRMRRNSIQGSGASASESEDESRRHTLTPTPKQTRPESTHEASDNQSNGLCTSQGKVKRKLLLSESARKLSEARRDFLMKHNNKEPLDRTKLKVYDFIYYNPIDNPMKERPVKPKPKLVERPPPPPIEDEVDDPEDNEIVAPQVTVGPDGQIIVDTKSLTIQRSSIKKAREEMHRYEVEEIDNEYGSGFYKRRPRAKEWPKNQTIKFYKALNTFGTDFSLMGHVFPERSRHDLKQKFKKEERVNTALVEKALSCFQEYDIENLEKELGKSESDTERVQTNKDVKKQKKKPRHHRIAVTSINQEAEDYNIPLPKPKRPKKAPDSKPTKKARKTKPKAKTLRPKAAKKPSAAVTAPAKSDESTAPESEEDSEKDQEELVYKPRATRSGRKPRITKAFMNKRKRIVSQTDEGSVNNDNPTGNDNIPVTDVPTNDQVQVSEQAEQTTDKSPVQENEKPRRKPRAIRPILRKKIKITNTNDDENDPQENVQVQAPEPVEKSMEIQKELPEKQTDTVREAEAPMDVEVQVPEEEKSTNNKTEISVQEIEQSLVNNSVQPGSLVIVSKESTDEPGKTVVQVYMVSGDIKEGQNIEDSMTRVELTPEMLSLVTNNTEKS